MLTRVPGSVRTITAMAAGIVLGATLVAPVIASSVAGAARPGALQTRASSCSGYDFQPIQTATKRGWALVGEIYRPDTGGDGYFVCHPDLPHRAIVTKVQFTVADRYTTNVRYCGLFRLDLRAGRSGASQVVAQVPDTSFPNGGGVYRLESTDVTNATIDHTRYAYWLQCQLNGVGRVATAPPSAGLRGANVIYQISAANG